MKKMLMVAGAVLAVVLSGCQKVGLGSSPSNVAVDFARAIAQKNTSEALDLCDIKLYDHDSYGFNPNRFDPEVKSKSDIKKLKEKFEKDGRELDVDRYEGVAIMEVIMTPSDVFPTYHVDGQEYTGESARVTVQYVRGKDKKSKGLKVFLIKVDSSWKVTGYTMVSDLDDDD